MFTVGTPMQVFLPKRGWTDASYVGRDPRDRMRHVVEMDGAEVSVRVEMTDLKPDHDFNPGDECVAYWNLEWRFATYDYRGRIRGLHFVLIDGVRREIHHHNVLPLTPVEEEAQ